MDKYNEDSKCPKCGGVFVKTRYGRIYGYEKIIRTCQRCNYQWGEEPLDKEQKEKNGKDK